MPAALPPPCDEPGQGKRNHVSQTYCVIPWGSPATIFDPKGGEPEPPSAVLVGAFPNATTRSNNYLQTFRFSRIPARLSHSKRNTWDFRPLECDDSMRPPFPAHKIKNCRFLWTTLQASLGRSLGPKPAGAPTLQKARETGVFQTRRDAAQIDHKLKRNCVSRLGLRRSLTGSVVWLYRVRVPRFLTDIPRT